MTRAFLNCIRHLFVLAPAMCKPHVAASLLTLTLLSLSNGTVRAQSPSDPRLTIVPIHLDTGNGDISVGCTVYARENCTVYKGSNPGLHLLALKRRPESVNPDVPILVRDGTFVDAGSANLFLETVRNNVPDALVIANGVGNYDFGLSSISQYLQQFGGAIDLEAVPNAIPFVFIGSGGQKMGEARQRGSSGLPFDGYLAKDSSQNFKFIQTDYVRYDITTDGTVTVGTTSYEAASNTICGGANSFHLLVVDREMPSKLLSDNTYCTATSDAEIARLITDLGTLVTNEGQLAFLASNGHPIPANWNFGTDGDGRIYWLGEAVAKLGGYFQTMIYLTPTDTYTLVGALPPPSYVSAARQRARENSSVYPGNPSGEIHGVLARGRGNWYSPISADPTQGGITERGFYDILAQTPVPFPHPTGAGELDAYAYINKQLTLATPPLLCSGCNVRDRYSDTNLAAGTYSNFLTALPDPNGNACGGSQSAYCTVRQQLLTEFQEVDNIHSFADNLANLWTAQGVNNLAELLGAYSTLQATLNVPTAAPAPSLFGPIVNLLLGVSSFIPDIGPAFGIADTAFNFGASLTTDASGNAASSLTTTAGQLATQAVTQFAGQGVTLGTQFNFIYQDWGKLNALANALGTAPVGSGWVWDGTTAGTVLNAMAPNIEVAYYQSLMTTLYGIGSYLPECSNACPGQVNAPLWGQQPIWQQPQAYLVFDDPGPFVFGDPNKSAQPFNYASNSWYQPYTYPNDPANPATVATSTLLGGYEWLGISLLASPTNSGLHGLYDPPAASVLTHLFTPRAQQGLGVYRPAFFEGWPFPRVTCGASHDANNETTDLGCDWQSASAAPEALDAPLTSLRAQNGSRAQTRFAAPGEIEVPLVFHNNGSVEIRSMRINNISLRTLAGSGQAVLLSPAFPLQTQGIKPGDSVTTTLRISVPPAILKLAIGEEGSADNGRLDGFRFSFGHVIYPPKK